ncbi:MAG TPA: hypothetical protein VII92_05365 [Anaerolineae bacterium]
MSRILRITLAMLAPAVLVILFAIATYKPGPPGQAEVLVYDYLRYRDSTSQPTTTVQQIVEANRPGNLMPPLSKITFGSGIYWTTIADTRSSGVTPFPTATPWSSELSAGGSIPWPGGSLTGGSGRRSLPFPPVEVWCVVVRRAGQTLPGLVFLAQHQDLYYTEWIVHEPTAQTLPELNASLAAVGCNVTLQP